MRQAVNFRMNPESIAILSTLAKSLHQSKTAVVEHALQDYAQQKKRKMSPFLQFAGLLNEEDADEMLTVVRSSKNIKEMKVKL